MAASTERPPASVDPDPNAVVAYAYAVFSTDPLSDSRFLRRQPKSFHRHLVPPSPTTSPIFSLDDRTARILDAIAGLAVRQANHEVLAVALELVPSTSGSAAASGPVLSLFVASNSPDGVPHSTIVYLERLWTQLQGISREVHGEGKPKVKFEKNTPPRLYPGSPTPAIQAMESNLFYFLYAQSRRKFQKRFAKYYRLLLKSEGLLERWADSQRQKNRRDDTDELWTVFVSMLDTFVSCQDQFNNIGEWDAKAAPLHGSDWHNFWCVMNSAVRKADRLLSSPNTLRIWDSRAALIDADRPNLQHALNKITALHRQMHTLLNFAHSPRFCYILHSSIRFRVVPVPPAGRVKLPLLANETYWSHVRSCVLKKLEVGVGPGHMDVDADPNAAVAGGDLDVAVVDQLDNKRSIVTDNLAPHCECDLAAYLSNHGYAAFSHLGVSKLSCAACEIWLQSYNTNCSKLKFCTRGTHGKWYPKWSMPILNDAEVEKAIAATVINDVGALTRALLVQKVRERARSDSTTSSETGVHVPASHEEVAQKIVKPRKKRRPSGVA